MTSSFPFQVKSQPDKYHQEEFVLHEGEVIVYRTKHSGPVWQFRAWIRENKRYFRQSLRTKDREIAFERARELFLDIHTKIRTGGQIFDMSVRQVCDEYLMEQEKRIRKGETGKGNIGITEGRFVTIRTQVNRHLVPFLGEKTKLATISGDQFKNNYSLFRRKTNATVQDVTIINERATIGSIFRFAFDKGWIKQNQIPRWEEMSKSSKSRDAFELEEWRDIYDYLRSWKKNEANEKIIEQKSFIKNFILILANTGLRFGELRFLRWNNIKVFKEDPRTNVRINIDISKTGRRQNVIGRRGDLFQKLKQLSKHTHPSDLIFVDNETGKAISKKVYYKLWDEITRNIPSIKNKVPKPSYYCLRHTYATFRLYANVPIFDLAENMGCSVKFIEEHYGHVNRLKRSKILTKDFDEASKLLIDA